MPCIDAISRAAFRDDPWDSRNEQDVNILRLHDLTHGAAMNSRNSLHGMHRADDAAFARRGHAHADRACCANCRGPGPRSSDAGTVPSLVKADRILQTDARATVTVRTGTPLGCGTCH